MSKFKFSVYDYSKIGIPKRILYYARRLTEQEWDILKNISYTKEGAIQILINEVRQEMIYHYPSLTYDPNFDFRWKIETPEKTYRSNETSS